MPTRLLIAAVFLLPSLAWAQTTRPKHVPSVDEKLAMRLEDFSLDGLTISQALTAIAEKTRVNFAPEWSNLAAMGVDRDRKLRGRLFDISARQAIDVALLEAGAKSPPDVAVNEDLVVITGPKAVVTRVYRIGKLLPAAPPAQPPAAAEPNGAPDPGEQLMKAVQQIDPDTWRDAGGILGSLTLFGRKLVVTQTLETHARIEQLLKDLEQADAK